MKIAIFGQFYQDNSGESISRLVDILIKKNVDLFIEKNFFKLIKSKDFYKDSFSSCKTYDSLDNTFDLLFSIGGDGTILRAATHVRDLNIPIIGINTGRLGFLATIQTEEIEKAITCIFNNDYRISKRSLIKIETDPVNKNLMDLDFALNEIAVSRKNTTSMITIETQLDGEYLTSYWADGLIISTPTGSTGYSLSCGGPVITPGANSLVITPIAPHNLNARPLVIPDETEITLRVSGREDNFLVSLDSRIATLSNETIVTIKKTSFKIKLIELNDESFLKTLRKKLLWGEDRRN